MFKSKLKLTIKFSFIDNDTHKIVYGKSFTSQLFSKSILLFFVYIFCNLNVSIYGRLIGLGEPPKY